MLVSPIAAGRDTLSSEHHKQTQKIEEDPRVTESLRGVRTQSYFSSG